MKDTVKGMKRQATNWEKVTIKYILNNGLLSKIYLKLNHKKSTQLKSKYLRRQLIKEDIQMANKHMKRSSSSFVIRELQVKTIMSYQYMLIRMVKIKNLTIPNADEDVEQQELLLCGNAKW